jgi:polysaccharide biosynthesis protein PslH
MARLSTGAAARFLADWSAAVPFAAVHVMRLYLAPLAEPFLRQGTAGPRCVLDLDDDDAAVQEALADLSGNPNEAAELRAEAAKYRRLAAAWLPRFERVFVCSAIDAASMAAAHPAARFAILPNIGPSVTMPQRRLPTDGSFRLLFVGGLGYPPNADAARFLCGPVLDALRRRLDHAVRIDIVGAGSPDGIANVSGVRLHGYIADTSPFYAAAHVATAPLRAGGGTRIKVLEAFAHQVPVVATSIGAAGLEVEHGRDLLLADDAEGFADACLRLHARPALGEAMIKNASALLAARYTPSAIAATLAAALPV